MVKSRIQNSISSIRVADLLVFLIALFFFRPSLFEKYESLNMGFNLGLIALLALYLVIASLKNKTGVTVYSCMAVGYFLLLLTSTYINDGSLTRSMMYVGVGILSVLVFASIFKYEMAAFLNSMQVLGLIFIPLNLLTMLVLPGGFTNNGVHPVFLLGQATRFIYFFLPIFVSLLVRDYRKGTHPSKCTIALWICAETSLVIGQTAAGIVVVSALPLFILLLGNRFAKTLCSPPVYLAVQLTLFFILVFSTLPEQTLGLLQSLFQKDATLSSRTYIWDKVILQTESNPQQFLFGFGVLQNNEMIALFNFVHCHNHLLQVLFNGGVVSLTIFITLIGLSYWELMKTNSEATSRIISFGIFLFSIALLFDTVDGVRNYYLVLLILGSCSKYISQCDDYSLPKLERGDR